MKQSKLFLGALTLFLSHTVSAQINRLGEEITYKAHLRGALSDGANTPFWFSANQYGLGTPHTKNGYLSISLQRDANADKERNWRIGYGIEGVATAGMDNSHVILQQLYADFQWKNLRLSIGQKERPLELKNQFLSSGAMTSGINARPLPQVRLEVPDFLAVPGTRNWFSFKGHIAYGAYTDNGWQKNFNGGNTSQIYTADSKYHSKALLLRIGNEDKFPLLVTGGIEMSCQYGGEVWNVSAPANKPDENWQTHQKLEDGIKGMWHAFIPGGSDINDGDYANASGNHLGSWHLRLDWKGEGWSAGAYLEHFFEDESQMFWQYGWKDMLYGIEVNLPRNPFISTVLYEHLGTMDQSGSVYHDATANLPDQISGSDQYYCNHVYGAWQHAGFTMGSPLLISPIYNPDGVLRVMHNRVNAHHIGLCGQPIDQLSWRFMYTHEKSLGDYKFPLFQPQRAQFFLAELTYRPKQIRGLEITCAYGRNQGEILGNSNGALLNVSFTEMIKKHKPSKL